MFVFLDMAKLTDFWWKMLMSVKIKGSVTLFTYFLDVLYARYNCAKFHRCRICVTDFMEGVFMAPPPHLLAAPERPIWVGLRNAMLKNSLLYKPFRYLWDSSDMVFNENLFKKLKSFSKVEYKSGRKNLQQSKMFNVLYF